MKKHLPNYLTLLVKLSHRKSLCFKNYINFVFFLITLSSPLNSFAVNQKVLFIGNSMTSHGPAPAIGWNGDWGMAASSANNDYVHKVVAGLNITNSADWRKSYGGLELESNYANININQWFGEDKTFLPDVIIVRIGENASVNQNSKNSFKEKVKQVVDFIRDNRPQVKVIITTTFWRNSDFLYQNQALTEAASELNCSLVQLSNLEDMPGMKALSFSDPGVARHPSDAGMSAIADRILSVFQQSTTTYTANNNGFAYLDNGAYKIGFNLQMGGVIDYLSKSNENNSIINSFDNGRQLGVDSYNGPDYRTDNIYKNQGYISACESSGVLCDRTTWNGLPTGSYDGQLGGAPNSINWDPATQKLTIESKLWDWNMRQSGSLAKIYDQAEQTQVITFIAPNVIKVNVTTSMHINYLTGTYRNQVSPVGYLNGLFTKAAGYFGNSPYTNDPNIYSQTMPAINTDTRLLTMDATEKWAGLYNDANFGMAFVWKDNDKTVVAGSVAVNNPDNGRYSNKSNYIYHYRGFDLTGNSVVENEYYLVLGSPSEARCWAYSLNGISSSCSQCTAPAAPTVSASSTSVAPNTAVQLTSNGCSGTVTWSDGQTGNHVVTPSQTTTYTATCTVNGCTSAGASVTVNITNPPTSGVNCNSIQANIEYTSCDYIGGWVYDSNNPNTVVNLDIYEGGALVQGNLSAGNFRQDLLNAGLGNGYHGFQINIPNALKNGQDRTFTLRATGCTNTIANTQRTINCGAPTCTVPSAPAVSASATSVAPNTAVQLISSGCSGTVTWSDGQIGNHTVTPSQTTTYTATCTVNGCTSTGASVTISVTNPPTSGVNCNSIQGSFDVADCNSLAGWVYSWDSPNTVLTLDLYENNTLIQGNISAGNFRSDLLNAGVGNGYHGFTINTPTSLKNGQNRSLTFRVTGCTSAIANSRTINCAAPSCTSPSAPTVAASATSVTANTAVQLTSSGCSGTVTWSDGQTGNHTVTPSQTTTYSAFCTVNGCTSIGASITINVSSTPSTTNCNSIGGAFDVADCNSLEGWVYSWDSPNTALTVDLYDNNTLIQSNILAGNFRSDLLSAGVGNGYHGFAISTPASLKNGQAHNVNFRVTGCTSQIGGSSKTITCNSGARIGISEESENEAIQEIDKKLSVFPNPASTELQTSFYIEKGKKATLFVYDIKGNLHYKKIFNGKGFQKESISIPSGLLGIAVITLNKGISKETQKVYIVK